MVEASYLVIFDGKCPLCTWWVRYLIRRDELGRLRFVSLHDVRFIPQLEGVDFTSIPADTIVLLKDGLFFTQSEAVLQLLQAIRCPMLLIGCLKLIPKVVRDAAYRFVAKNRLHISGNRRCPILSKSEQQRILRP